MLERELTKENGLIAKSLPKGWRWKRIADTDSRRRHGAGFDGILWYGRYGVEVEVKVGNKPMTETEEKEREACRIAGNPYVTLYWYPDEWILIYRSSSWIGTLECVVKKLFAELSRD